MITPARCIEDRIQRELAARRSNFIAFLADCMQNHVDGQRAGLRLDQRCRDQQEKHSHPISFAEF